MRGREREGGGGEGGSAPLCREDSLGFAAGSLGLSPLQLPAELITDLRTDTQDGRTHARR